jgi:hypothetical protein
MLRCAIVPTTIEEGPVEMRSQIDTETGKQ